MQAQLVYFALRFGWFYDSSSDLGQLFLVGSIWHCVLVFVDLQVETKLMDVEDHLSLHALAGNATKERLILIEAAIAVETAMRNEAAEMKLMGKEDSRLLNMLMEAEKAETLSFGLEEIRSRCMPKLEAANIKLILQTLKVTNSWSGNWRLYHGDTEVKLI